MGWHGPARVGGSVVRAGPGLEERAQGRPDQDRPGVEPDARSEFNPGYRFYQANSILGSFYEGAGVDYDWRGPAGERE